MKILFVCRANVIRSQMAAAFYNRLTGTTDADSAGTVVDQPGQTLGERSVDRPASKLVVEAMRAKDIDVSGYVRTQLTPEMLDRYDLIVSMADDQYEPDWLKANPAFVHWQVDDPMALGLDRMVATRDTVEGHVRQLISADGSGS